MPVLSLLFFLDVERAVIDGGQIVHLAQICRTYVQYLADMGVEILSYLSAMINHISKLT